MRTLRFALALASAGALIATGCGNDSSGGGREDSGTTRLDSGAPGTDSGPGVDSGPSTTDAGPGTDGGGTTPGMCPEGACDLVPQGGCEAGQACQFLITSEGGDPEPVCVMAGLGGDGDECADYTECQEGYWCDTGDGICRAFCCWGSDTGCPVGQTCAIQFSTPGGAPTGVGYCSLPDACDPVAQDCGGDEGCYARDDGSVQCLANDGLGEGQACEFSNDCAPGLQCFRVGDGSPVCHKFCDTGAGSACAAEQTCQGLGYPEPLGTLGLCNPAAGT